MLLSERLLVLDSARSSVSILLSKQSTADVIGGKRDHARARHRISKCSFNRRSLTLRLDVDSRVDLSKSSSFPL